MKRGFGCRKGWANSQYVSVLDMMHAFNLYKLETTSTLASTTTEVFSWHHDITFFNSANNRLFSAIIRRLMFD